MWKVEKTQPMDFNRSTIYSNEKNLKAQYDKYNQKKHVNDIKNQASFTYHFDKSRIDRSIVLAPTRNTKIENYIIQHNNSKSKERLYFLRLRQWEKQQLTNPWIVKNIVRGNIIRTPCI